MPWVVEVTSAMALVTHSKIARGLANVFLSLQRNPYPTRGFNIEAEARAWLKQFL